MNHRFVPSLLLMLILMSTANTGCQKSPDVPLNAATAVPAAVATSHTPPPRAVVSVPATSTTTARNVQRTKEKTAERSAEKGPSASAVPPSPTQLALGLVFREMALQARFKETDDKAARGAISAEIKAVRHERQSLYQRPQKGSQP